MPLIMLCGVGLRFNLVRDELLEGVSDKRSPEDRELLVGFQAAEAFSRFHHSSGCPAQRHRSISPSLHIATDATHGPHHVLDWVGAGERAPELCRHSEAIDGQYLVEPFKDAGGDTGRLPVEPAGEIAQQPLSLVGIASSQACRSARRIDACSGLGSRSITLRAL